MSDRVRADRLLCARGLATTRAKAQDLIRGGRVTASGRTLWKPGVFLDDDTPLAVTEARTFVSRGGDKLDAALDALSVDVAGAVVVDIGASTGGFTDCVLQRGARKVYAIDVGHDQLDSRLRSDPRVVSREGTNARDLSAADFADPVELVVVDASFIALDKLLPAVARIAPPGARLVALVKPQFEVGRDAARKTRGVVRDPELRARAILAARSAVERAGFTLRGEVDSVLPGPAGNVEHFLFAVRREH